MQVLTRDGPGGTPSEHFAGPLFNEDEECSTVVVVRDLHLSRVDVYLSRSKRRPLVGK